MTVVTREVSWGDALMVEAFKAEGGLRAVTSAIAAEIGPHIGTRNTFAKLLRVDDPSTLAPRDRWRAWLLLTALGQNPSDWGINDEEAPAHVSVDLLATALRSRVRHQGLEPRTR